MRIVFCNIAYMKNYCGINGDKPVNGGRWIAEHGDGGETYNFYNYNGQCYGYFKADGETTHIENIEGISINDSSAENVLVIWVAKKDNDTGNVIVGWYENAKVYRCGQHPVTFKLHPGYPGKMDYRVVAKAADCYLLPEEHRTFVIEQAARAGEGKGIGRKAIWYANTEYARDELIPRVREYIEGCKASLSFINKRYTDEFLAGAYDKSDKTVEELEQMAKQEGIPEEEALYYLNAVLREKQSPELLRLQVELLVKLCRFDVAIMLLEPLCKANPNDVDLLRLLQRLYQATHKWREAKLVERHLRTLTQP